MKDAKISSSKFKNRVFTTNLRRTLFQQAPYFRTLNRMKIPVCLCKFTAFACHSKLVQHLSSGLTPSKSYSDVSEIGSNPLLSHFCRFPHYIFKANKYIWGVFLGIQSVFDATSVCIYLKNA